MRSGSSTDGDYIGGAFGPCDLRLAQGLILRPGAENAEQHEAVPTGPGSPCSVARGMEFEGARSAGSNFDRRGQAGATFHDAGQCLFRCIRRGERPIDRAIAVLDEQRMAVRGPNRHDERRRPAGCSVHRTSVCGRGQRRLRTARERQPAPAEEALHGNTPAQDLRSELPFECGSALPRIVIHPNFSSNRPAAWIRLRCPDEPRTTPG